MLSVRPPVTGVMFAAVVQLPVDPVVGAVDEVTYVYVAFSAVSRKAKPAKVAVAQVRESTGAKVAVPEEQ
jgi:hypothetical protein